MCYYFLNNSWIFLFLQVLGQEQAAPVFWCITEGYANREGSKSHREITKQEKQRLTKIFLSNSSTASCFESVAQGADESADLFHCFPPASVLPSRKTDADNASPGAQTSFEQHGWPKCSGSCQLPLRVTHTFPQLCSLNGGTLPELAEHQTTSQVSLLVIENSRSHICLYIHTHRHFLLLSASVLQTSSSFLTPTAQTSSRSPAG